MNTKFISKETRKYTLLSVILCLVLLGIPCIFGVEKKQDRDEIMADNVNVVLDDMEFCKYSKIILEDGVTEDDFGAIWFNGKNLHLESKTGEVVRMKTKDIDCIKCLTNTRSVREYIISSKNDSIKMKSYYPQFPLNLK